MKNLAKQLANPIASLISIPIELDFDNGYGVSDNGERFTLTMKPVAPFRLNDNWNLITRTIVPALGPLNGIAYNQVLIG